MDFSCQLCSRVHKKDKKTNVDTYRYRYRGGTGGFAPHPLTAPIPKKTSSSCQNHPRERGLFIKAWVLHFLTSPPFAPPPPTPWGRSSPGKRFLSCPGPVPVPVPASGPLPGSPAAGVPVGSAFGGSAFGGASSRSNICQDDKPSFRGLPLPGTFTGRPLPFKIRMASRAVSHEWTTSRRARAMAQREAWDLLDFRLSLSCKAS